MNDLRFAFRQFLKAPGFTAVAVLTLALGIGVNTAMFSVVYGVLLDPYPYAKSNEIWAPLITDAKTGRGTGSSRLSDYLELAKLPAVGSAMATAPDQATMAGALNPEVIGATRLSGTAFEFLGVPPVIGRTFTSADIQANGEPQPVAVISFKLWQRLFNGEPSALGQTLTLDGTPHTIVGVMPPRFGWYGDDGLWRPLGTTDRLRRVNPIVRFKPGVTQPVAEEQFRALCEAIFQAEPARMPKNGYKAAFLNYLDITVSSGEMRSSLHLLFCAVGFLLLIACTNVANLQLARGAARSREIAIRLAVGASRWRLIRQLLTESVALALAGGLLGVLFAWGLTQLIVALMPSFYVPNEARVTLNGWVLAFSVGVSVLTGIVFGLVPGLQCTRPDLNEALKDGGHSGGAAGGKSAARTRSTLVVVEVALSIVLLVGASLAIRGFVDLQRVDRGFRTEHTLLLRLPLDVKRYATLEQRNRFAGDLLDRIRALPGVASASVGTLPFFEASSGGEVPGQPKIEGGLGLNLIDADYLRTLGIALRSGRNLSAQEVAHGDPVAIINEAAAKLWPAGVDPLGRTIQIDALVGGGIGNLAPAGAAKDVTVVGIVTDPRNARNVRSAPTPVFFVPYTLRGPATRMFIVKANVEPMSLLNTVRAEVKALDREQPLQRPVTADEIMGEQTVQPRFNMALLTGLAAIALALAAAGIYSVLSYSVTQRTREIGVRMALGAGRGDILRLILGAGSRLLGLGLACGLAASVALAKFFTSEVFTVPLLDPLALAAAAAILSAVALLACYLPARRATKVDPLVALRCE
jgi:putative ABC transport system permease protein